MCVGSVKKFFKRLRERDALAWFVLLIVAVYLVFLAFSPVFRYGDDMRYFATAKTIALTGDLAPKYEMFGGTVFDGPPLMPYILTGLYLVSFGNQLAWFWLAKIFSLLTFFGALHFLNKFADKYKLSGSQKIIALGLFSFFPASMFTSISAMQDLALTFFSMALFWEIMKDKNSLALVFALAGLLSLVKTTGFIVLLAALVTILIMKKEKSEKIKIISAIALGALIMGGWWFLRNYMAYGDVFYYHGFEGTWQLFPGENAIGKIFYSYLSSWGIPYTSNIVSKIGIASPNTVLLLQAAAGLFFAPIILLFFYTIRKEIIAVKYLIPLIIFFFLFSYFYMPLKLSWIDSRLFLPALPFVSIIIGKCLNQAKRKKTIIMYFIIAFVLFIAIAAATNTNIKQRQDALLSSFEKLNQGQHGQLLMLGKDWEFRDLTSLYFNMSSVPVEQPDCRLEKSGTLAYCISGGNLFVARESYIA